MTWSQQKAKVMITSYAASHGAHMTLDDTYIMEDMDSDETSEYTSSESKKSEAAAGGICGGAESGSLLLKLVVLVCTIEHVAIPGKRSNQSLVSET